MSFHGVQEGRYVLRVVKGLRSGLVGDVNDGPQEGLVAQGTEIMLKIRSGGGKGVDFRQPGVASYGVQLVTVRKGLRHGNNIQRQIGVVPGKEQPPQQLVRRDMEKSSVTPNATAWDM